MKIVFLIIILIFLLYIIKVNDEIKNLKYDFDLESINISSFNIQDYLNQGSRIKIKSRVDVLNNGFLPLCFKDLNISLYYKNKLLAKSNKEEDLNFQRICIAGNKITSIYQYFDVFINNELLEFLGKIKTNQKTEIQYDVSLKWNGVSFRPISSYAIN